MKKLSLIWLLAGCAMAFQPPAVNLSGTILDLKNAPVAEATITITHKEGQKFNKTITSKKNGRFNVLSIPAGLIDVAVTKDGYQTQNFEFDLRPDRKRASFRLMPNGSSLADLAPQTKLSGQVVDTKGNGIPEVTLLISSTNLKGFEKEVTTDGSGNFSVEMLNAAIIKIHTKKSNYRDTIYQYYHGNKDVKMPAKDLTMQTLDEAYAELGENAPKREMKPEAQAIELYNLAVGPYKEGNLDVAADYASKAIEKDPKQTSAIQMLVYIYAKKGELAKAQKYATDFLALKPGDPGMTKYADQIAKNLKSPGAAPSSGGDNAQSYFNKAVDEINANNDSKAAELLKKSLEKDETFALAHFELGKIYVREFEFEKAITELKLYLKHAPEDHKSRKEATDLIVTLSE